LSLQVDDTIVEIPITAILCETNISRCPAAKCIGVIVDESRAAYQASTSTLRHFSKFLSLALLLAFERQNPESYARVSRSQRFPGQLSDCFFQALEILHANASSNI
jgi:hypothetical protein